MAGFVRSLSLRARFYFSAVAPGRREASLADHRAIVDALRRRDAADAEQIGRAHVASTRQDLRRALTAIEGSRG